MNDHLTSEQIAKCAAGVAAGSEQQHALACDRCSQEIAGLQRTISIFREAVWKHAEAQNSGVRFKTPPVTHPFSLRWVLVTAGLLVLLLLPVYRSITNSERVSDAAADQLLLERVDAHLSQPVPRSMQPFLELFVSETAVGENSVGEEQ